MRIRIAVLSLFLVAIMAFALPVCADVPEKDDGAADVDSDHDGVPDKVEARLGTLPDDCDTDHDGLSDGVELGYIQPDDYDGCHGLQPAGTNYSRPAVLDPLNPDSDGDGITDGDEDANGNGWVDPSESDPTVDDSDGDGLTDGLERYGDFDGDGLPDFDFHDVHGEGACLIPDKMSDIDCDGIPNTIDLDSDGDGCPDAEEGVWVDANANGVPDVYDPQVNSCPQNESSVSAGGSLSGQKEESSTEGPLSVAYAGAEDGGACALIDMRAPCRISTGWPGAGCMAFFLTLLAYLRRLRASG